jgi:hypothetical protein
MLTDNGLEVDFNALEQVLTHADVLIVGFNLFAERMLIDARTTDKEGPLVAIVEPVGGIQERYLWLGKHRGDFGAPEAFSFFVWPHTVRSFVERNVLATMRARLNAVSSASDDVLDRTLERLLALEREAFRNAIRGEEPWRALWTKQPG